MMDAALLAATREERGLALARTARIKRAGELWIVPSQSMNAGSYVVRNGEDGVPICTCPDWETRQAPCKHIFAVEFVRHQRTEPDGTTVVTETMKVTYAQNWRPYRQARMNEKEVFERLLSGLCRGVEQPQYKGDGRPAYPLGDVIFAATHKVFQTLSGDRATSDLRACRDRGLIEVVPHPNTVFRIMRMPEMVPILRNLIEVSASPLRAIESDFAADATGIATKTYVRWFDKKWGKEKREKKWLKLHIMVGVLTQIITAAEVTTGNRHDSPFLPDLINKTAANGFTMTNVSADKGYHAKKNLRAIVSVGADPYIPFKPNSKPNAKDPLWNRALALFTLNKPAWEAEYHKRSLSETTFSSMKRLLGAAVRAKTFEGQVSEVYTKVLAYNLHVLVHAIFELGIDPDFLLPPNGGGLQ